MLFSAFPNSPSTGGRCVPGIHLQLAQRSIAEIEARHNRNLDAFLTTQKQKGTVHYRGGVFRDTIIESDYDPMAPHQEVIKVTPTADVCRTTGLVSVALPNKAPFVSTTRLKRLL